MFRLQRVLSAGVIAAMLMKAAPVLAPYHVLVIEQMFFGTADAPNAQYVMLRTLAPFQIFVNNQKISAQAADGSAAPEFGAFDALTAPRTDSGVAILMGTPEAEGRFGVTMDKVTSGRLVQPDGRICFGEFAGSPVDCVAYGAFTGANPSGGAPAPAPVAGMALVRVANTHNDAADFRLAAPCPQNNAGASGLTCPTPTPTSVPSKTSSPSPTGTQRPTPPITDYVCPGDCNRDRTVMINEVVTGVNIALDRAGVDTCIQADVDRDGSVHVNELVASVNSILRGCPELGTRRFSLDPTTSSFTAVLNVGLFPSTGMTGFIELKAGVPSAEGVAFLDITDSSDYLSVLIPASTGGVDTVICIKPHKNLFPITTAGVIDCDGGSPVGFSTAQDHNIGVVAACTAGANAGQACTSDANCPNGHCYAAVDCEAAGGVVEGPTDTHPGVCNGPLEASQIVADAGPGAVFIGRDPSGFFNGLPATLTIETAFPCGNEGGEIETNFAFTTGTSRATVNDFANSPGATFMHETHGTNFSCRDFAKENSAGTLVLEVPTLDLSVPVLGTVDFISEFTLDD